MTTNTPLRCANSAMTFGDGYTWLMDTGNYPSYSSYLNETWKYNATTNTWTNTAATLIDANGPLPGRSQQVMVYDGYHVMLYGGQGGSSTAGVFEDTWTFNGTSWTKGTPTNPPFGRYGAKAAFQAGVGTVMFGGFGGAGNGVYLLETWIWDGSGSTWTIQNIGNGLSPKARIQHVMAASTTQVLLFGGVISSGEFQNDTWAFSGGAWTQLHPATSPSVRGNAVMSYDSANSIYVLFGGMNEYNYLPETWTFNGTTWTQQSPTVSPPGLIGAQMCFDTNSNTTILYGGISATTNYPSNQTWSFNGSTLNWTKS